MKDKFVVKFLTVTYEILRDIGVGWSQIPYKGFRYSSFNSYGYEPRNNYIGFKNLEHRGIIRSKGKDSFVFTKSGKGWLEKSQAKYFRLKNKKWDGSWRIVIFDIPQEFRKSRNILRRRLQWWGFRMLQKSVFVLPYACEEEVGILSSQLKLSDYVDIITAKHIGSKEKEMRKIFKI